MFFYMVETRGLQPLVSQRFFRQSLIKNMKKIAKKCFSCSDNIIGLYRPINKEGIMNSLREELLYLKNKHNLAGLKGGTEVEAMTFEEILEMKKLSGGIVPMVVKIGGPEARNDIDYMLSIGIDKILAPMIESVYGLKNFVATIEEMDKKRAVRLAINIETITAYKNIESIVSSPYFLNIEQVTVGRTDLSASMEKTVDSGEITAITKEIIDLSRLNDKKTSCGGKINPNNALMIKETINPDFINTRNVIIDCHSSHNISNDIQRALLWEKKFYEYMMNRFPARENFYSNLINTIDSRLVNKAKEPDFASNAVLRLDN